jgi:NADH:ubiquinone oxidoreductase subunit E
MPKTDHANIQHAARIIALDRAQRNGWLNNKTLQEIADHLDVHRSTIMRNLRDLSEIRTLSEQYINDLAPSISTKPE